MSSDPSAATNETGFRIEGLPRPVRSDELAAQDLEQVLVRFTAELRDGRTPPVDAYLERYPALASELRELFPVVASMEQWKRWRELPGPNNDIDLERLRELGECEIVREIGRGGMGVVFEAFERRIGRNVAVKVLLKKALTGADWRERFQREARIVARLQHAHIVPVYRYGEERGYCYYVMPLVDGISLAEVIAALRKDGAVEAHAIRRSPGTGEGPPPLSPASKLSSADAIPPAAGSARWLRKNSWNAFVRIILQIAKALRYAHAEGVLHRDIKPANILLDSLGMVRVTDFGLALRTDPVDSDQDTVAAGTLRFMAPELFIPAAAMDVCCDIYALGMTLYELATLRPAYDATDKAKLIRMIQEGPPPTPRSINSDIPVALERILLKALRRDPRSRYQTMDALMVDLRRVLPLVDRLQTATKFRRWWLRHFGR